MKKKQVRGLCGVFNYDVRDDLTMAEGQVTVNAAEFGNSWKAGHACEKDAPLLPTSTGGCKVNLNFHKEAERACKIFKNGTF